MWQSIRQLDHILRGETTTLPALRAGSLDAPAGAMPLVLILLAVIYGVCVAVQMAGILRPFVGVPHSPGVFLRHEHLGNV